MHMASATEQLKLYAKLSGLWSITAPVKFVWMKVNEATEAAVVCSETICVVNNLTAGEMFNLTVTASQISTTLQNQTSRAETTVKVVGAPKAGTCKVKATPDSQPHVELTTELSLECSGFGVAAADAAAAASYQLQFTAFATQAEESRRIVGRTGWIPPDSATNIPMGLFPVGNFSFFVEVANNFGAYVEVPIVGPVEMTPTSTIAVDSPGCQGSAFKTFGQATSECCELTRKLEMISVTNLSAAEQVYFLVPTLQQARNSGEGCDWAAMLVAVYRRFNDTRARDLLDKTGLDKFSEAFYFLTAATFESPTAIPLPSTNYIIEVTVEAMQSLEQLVPKYPSHLVCSKLRAVGTALLKLPKFACLLVERALTILEKLRCTCASAVLLPGETETLPDGGEQGSFSKCIVSASGCAASLPPGFDIDESVWAKILDSVEQDPIFGRVAGVSVVTQTELVRKCRIQNSSSLPDEETGVGDITSITIISGCKEVAVTNQSGNGSEISFNLPILPKSGKSTTCQKSVVFSNCTWWNKIDRVWSSNGCVTVPINSTTVHCKCTHLTDFAVLYRVNSGCNEPDSVAFVINTVGFSIVGLACLVQLGRLLACSKSRGKHKNLRGMLLRRHTMMAVLCTCRLIFGWILNNQSNASELSLLLSLLAMLSNGLWFICFNAMVIQWFFVHHYSMNNAKMGRMKPTTYVINLLVSVLIVIGFVLSSVVDSGTNSAISMAVGVAIATLTIFVGIFFLIYGTKLSCAMKKKAALKLKKTQKKSYRATRLFASGLLLSVLFIAQAGLSVAAAVGQEGYHNSLQHRSLFRAHAALFALTVLALLVTYYQSVRSLLTTTKAKPQVFTELSATRGERGTAGPSKLSVAFRNSASPQSIRGSTRESAQWNKSFDANSTQSKDSLFGSPISNRSFEPDCSAREPQAASARSVPPTLHIVRPRAMKNDQF